MINIVRTFSASRRRFTCGVRNDGTFSSFLVAVGAGVIEVLLADELLRRRSGVETASDAVRDAERRELVAYLDGVRLLLSKIAQKILNRNIVKVLIMFIST